MAVAFKASLGFGADTLTGNVIGIATTAPIAVGDLVVVRFAADQLSASTPTFTVTDAAGNAYITHQQLWKHTSVAADGIAGGLAATKATAAMATGQSIIVTLSGAVAAKVAYAESFTGAANVVRSTPVGVTGGVTITTPPTGTVNAGDLVLSWSAWEHVTAVTGDSDTVDGAWSAIVNRVNAAGGTGTTRVQVSGQWKIPTGSTPQVVTNNGAASDSALGIVVLQQATVVPPDPTPPGHVTIDGMLFCVPAHGVAVRVEVRTPTQLLDVTDLIQRASWQQGGTYDGGRSPWFNPTPNPCELELATTDPKWDPTTIGAYDLTPLSTNIKILLAEQATFGAGVWSTKIRFYGPLIARTYEPAVGGGARVVLSGADALTNLGDMILDERAEEAPWQRLAWLASGVKDLAHSFAAGAGMDTPTLGRYHPDQGMTRLELMTDSALAAGQALMFQPLDYDEPPPAKTIVYQLPQGAFSNPAVVHTAAVDPELGMTVGGGNVPAWGANTRVACLTGIALARQDAGFRTRLRSARSIAPWTVAVNAPGPISALPAGNHFYQSPSFVADAGDRYELIVGGWEGVYWSAAPTYRAFTNPHAIPGPGQVQSLDFRLNTTSGEAPNVRYGYEVPTSIPTGSFVIGRYFMVPSGTVSIGVSFTETVRRLGGNGPELETVVAARETTYGQRAVTGFRSPIARQADLSSWNTRALDWVNGVTTYPRLLRVASSAGHPSPGAQQWAVHLYAGGAVALRHVPTPAAPDSVTIYSWAVNVATTLTPTEITVDVECGPRTSGST